MRGKVDFGDQLMKKLKIYIDESGEFGFKDGSSDLYVVSMVMYDTSKSITSFLNAFNERLKEIGYTGMIHMGDLVRHKGDYKNFDISKRKDIFNAIFHLTRKLPINIHSIIIDKKYTSNNKVLKRKILLELNSFIENNQKYFSKFDEIMVFYDNGQNILGNAIDIAFSNLNNYEHIIDFDKIQERLFQISDMLTNVDKFDFKYKNKLHFSKNEKIFFELMEMRKLLTQLEKKRF